MIHLYAIADFLGSIARAALRSDNQIYGNIAEGGASAEELATAPHIMPLSPHTQMPITDFPTAKYRACRASPEPKGKSAPTPPIGPALIEVVAEKPLATPASAKANEPLFAEPVNMTGRQGDQDPPLPQPAEPRQTQGRDSSGPPRQKPGLRTGVPGSSTTVELPTSPATIPKWHTNIKENKNRITGLPEKTEASRKSLQDQSPLT